MVDVWYFGVNGGVVLVKYLEVIFKFLIIVLVYEKLIIIFKLFVGVKNIFNLMLLNEVFLFDIIFVLFIYENDW